MSGSAHQRAAQVVARYHEAELSKLMSHVEAAVMKHRAGELDAFEADQDLFQYSRAAKELWKFCTLGNVVDTAEGIERLAEPIDWWEAGAFRRR